jgi:dipeptidyl aminopeptidase/acylaminoacyl peptidase
MPLLAALLFAQALAAAESTIPDLHHVPEASAVRASGIPAVPPELRRRVLPYLHSRAAGLLDATPDGEQILIGTRFGTTRQMHLVDHPRGDRFQLTFSDEPVATARFLPGEPRIILYTQDVGGAESFQILGLDLRTGRTTLLTDGKSRHTALQLSRDGTRAAFSSNARNGRDTDVYLGQPRDLVHARRLTEEAGTLRAGEFSPDGAQLLAVRYRAVSDADLLLFEVASGKRRQLTPAKVSGSVRHARFSADGKSVYVVTDRFGDVDELYRLDLAAPEAAPVPLTRSLRWNVEQLAVSRDGTRLALTVNEDGRSALYLCDPKTGALERRQLPAGVVSSLQFPEARSDRLLIDLGTPRTPGDVYHLDLATGELVRWTRSEAGGLSLESFVEPQLVRYPSTDGVRVPAFVYRPQRPPAGKMPVVVYWHGGPEGQSRPSFQPFVQMLVDELGAAVILPNVRGSDGYGKEFLAMDDGVKREAALADVGATFDFIASQPDLDPERVGVYGGSYGGYLALASAAFFPKRVRAAVDVVGISSLPTFLNTTQGYRRDLRRAEYGDERDPAVRAVQERISPLGKVDQIEAALLVQQGKNDPRVPQSEAEQLVRALRSRGRDVWYLLALDEGHGFRKKANAEYAATATVLFFREKLLPAKAAERP